MPLPVPPPVKDDDDLFDGAINWGKAVGVMYLWRGKESKTEKLVLFNMIYFDMRRMSSGNLLSKNIV